MAKFKNSKLEWRERRIRDSFTTERIVKNELVNKDINTLTTAINLKYRHDYFISSYFKCLGPNISLLPIFERTCFS